MATVQAERAPRVTDPKALEITRRAQELAPTVRSPFRPSAAESLMVIVGRKDPIRFLGLRKGSLAGREPRDVLAAWVRGELPADDPAAVAIRDRMRDIGADPRARNLWSRMTGAMLLAIADLK